MHPLLAGEGPLYRRLAEGFRQGLAAGRYRPGERLPSVRQLSESLDLSLSTVNQALRLLEAEGWVEVRPQSGCYVTHQLPVPEATQAPPPTPVKRTELGLSLLKEASQPELTRLGATIPNPDLLPTQDIRRHMQRLAREGWPNRYDWPRGSPELRQQIARLSLDAGISVGPEDVLLSAGCLDALVACLRVLCREGDVVAVESPTFFGYLEIIEMLRLRALEVPSHPQTGLRLGVLRRALAEHDVRCVLVTPNFSNPQGALMSEDDKRELAGLGLPVIENDVSGELSYATPRPLTAKARDTEGNVLYCSSFSKTLGPEWRVGWVLAGRYQAEVERTLTYQNFGSSALVRRALADYLASGAYAGAVRRARRIYARQAAQTWDILRQMPGRVYLPQGGKMLWAELSCDALGVYRKAREQRISVTPGQLYSTGGWYDHCLRINCSYGGPEVEAALRRLVQVALSAVR